MVEQKNEDKQKRVLITGVSGQDGGHLAEFLLTKGYDVYAMHRRSSNDHHLDKVKHLFGKINFVEGDLLDTHSLNNVVEKVLPDEVYNLAAQSHVRVSFDQPWLTHEINWHGMCRLFAACERAMGRKFKFYQASTSELFGEVLDSPQNELTPFNPVSPYSRAKLEAHNYIKLKREQDYFACAGILFNHEGENRSIEFVTRKITDGAVRFSLGLPQNKTGKKYLELGNLDSKRDWGYARDYVEAMWLMMQQDKPDDYVIATGENHTIREFVERSFDSLGYKVTWSGKGVDEIGYVNGDVAVRINPDFYRPCEVDVLLGDASKAKRVLGWTPRTSFDGLVKLMVDADMNRLNVPSSSSSSYEDDFK